MAPATGGWLSYPLKGESLLTIAIASNGQRTVHFAQPVQPASSCIRKNFFQFSTSSDSTCGGHTATHQPQPVQRVL